MADMQPAPEFICTSCIRERARKPSLICDHAELSPCSTCAAKAKTADQCILVRTDDALLKKLHEYSAIISGFEVAEPPGGIPPHILDSLLGFAEIAATSLERIHLFHSVKEEEHEAVPRPAGPSANSHEEANRLRQEIDRLRQRVSEKELAFNALVASRAAEEEQAQSCGREKDAATTKLYQFDLRVQQRIIFHLIGNLASLEGHTNDKTPKLKRPKLIQTNFEEESVEENLQRNKQLLSEEEHTTWVDILTVSKSWRTRAEQFLGTMTWPLRIGLTTTGSSRAHRIITAEETYEEQQAVKEEHLKSESKKRKRKREKEPKSETRPPKLRRNSDDVPIPCKTRAFILRETQHPKSFYREPHETNLFDDPDDATYVPSVFGD